MPCAFRVLDEVLDEHPELGAPVAEVILPDDVRTEEPQHASEAVTDDRGAQVADVHLLGDVRRRVVDDRPPALLGHADAQARAGQPTCDLPPYRRVGEGEVEKAGPGDRDLGHGCAGVGTQRLGDGGGKVARSDTSALGERERGVRLEIRMLGAPHRRIGSGPFRQHPIDRTGDGGLDLADQRGHDVLRHPSRSRRYSTTNSPTSSSRNGAPASVQPSRS